MREGHGRVSSFTTDNTNNVICCHGRGKLLELFYFAEDESAVKRFRNRQRKFRKKSSK